MGRGIALTVTRQQNGFDDAGFANAFERAGYDVVNFDDRTFLWYHAASPIERLARRALRKRQVAAFNSELQRYIDVCRPNIFFVFKGSAVSSATVDCARSAGARTVFFYPDLEPAVHGPDYVAALRQADGFFHTKPNLVEHMRSTVGSNAEFTYPVYDAALVDNPVAVSGPARLLVVANHSPGKAALIEKIVRADVFDIEIFGNGWPNEETGRVRFGGPLFGPAVRNMQRSATAVLGLLTEQLDGFASGDTVTARSIHVPAYGGLLLHQFTDDARRLYDNDASLFRDIDDLIDKMSMLSNSPDQRLVLATQQQQSVLRKAHSQDSFVNTIQGQ